MSKILEVRDLHRSYHDGRRELNVLCGAELSVAAGEVIAVIGMSGAGKSTLLHLLGGLDRPDKGSIAFDGEEITAWPRERMDQFRNRSIGFVFQFHHLLPEFTALENVMMPALVARESKSVARAKARELLKLVGLDERERHLPSKLSGGEAQRVALARALVNEPRLILADEPTGNLDPKTGEKIIDILWKTVGSGDRALIIVTHEPLIAERAHRILRLKKGRLVAVDRSDLARQMGGA